KQVIRHFLHALFNRNNLHLTVTRQFWPRSSLIQLDTAVKGGPQMLDAENTRNAMLDIVRPKQEVVISVTCGTFGFRKAARGEFDAAYETTIGLLKKMEEKNMLNDEHSPIPYTVTMRGFSKGRMGFISALQAPDSAKLVARIDRFIEDTPIKFGGTRSRKVRRL
ncbi:hypothetical protein CANCADRAFT_20001, partial [Tortispora caseinolytica NRRL Y-17796]